MLEYVDQIIDEGTQEMWVRVGIQHKQKIDRTTYMHTYKTWCYLLLCITSG